MKSNTTNALARLIADRSLTHLAACQYWIDSIIDHATKDCESPIEELMAVALLFASWPVAHYDRPYDAARPDEMLPCWMRSHWAPETWDFDTELRGRTAVIISPQQKILEYRVDFLVIAKLNPTSPRLMRAIVECDGHEFHDRTKEQAIRDRQRDRALQAEGYGVFRFTGSEIHNDAGRCTAEVMAAMCKLAEARAAE